MVSGCWSTGCGRAVSARAIRGLADGYRRLRRLPSCGAGMHTSRNGFDEFAARYADELKTAEGAAALAELRAVMREGPVTLVTAARDLDGSHVAVLARMLS